MPSYFEGARWSARAISEKGELGHRLHRGSLVELGSDTFMCACARGAVKVVCVEVLTESRAASKNP